MDEMATTIGLIMQGGCDPSDIANLLLALRDKGETVDEVAGAAQAMRSQMQTIQSPQDDLLDTCGTGGDGSNTFNVRRPPQLSQPPPECRSPNTATVPSPARRVPPMC